MKRQRPFFYSVTAIPVLSLMATTIPLRSQRLLQLFVLTRNVRFFLLYLTECLLCCEQPVCDLCLRRAGGRCPLLSNYQRFFKFRDLGG